VGLELMVTAVAEWVRNALRTVALLPRRAGQHQHHQHHQPAPHSKEAAAAAGNLPRSHSAQACLVSAVALLHGHVEARALPPQQLCLLQHPQCQTQCSRALACAASALQYRSSTAPVPLQYRSSTAPVPLLLTRSTPGGHPHTCCPSACWGQFRHPPSAASHSFFKPVLAPSCLHTVAHTHLTAHLLRLQTNTGGTLQHHAAPTTPVGPSSMRRAHSFSSWEQVATPGPQRPIDQGSAADMIKLAGYPLELHTVTTEDGYILRMERIPRPGVKDVVLFMHGILDTSLTWVSAGEGAGGAGCAG
jgi:hypothetical protein